MGNSSDKSQTAVSVENQQLFTVVCKCEFCSYHRAKEPDYSKPTGLASLPFQEGAEWTLENEE